MRVTCGTFALRTDAERAARRLRARGLDRDRVILLVPEDFGKQLQRIPLSYEEGPGMGVAMGIVLGAAFGLAWGIELLYGGAFSPLAGMPGFWGVAVLSLLAAGAGGLIGRVVDHATTDGLPIDKLPAYEQALRNRLSVVLVFTDHGNLTKFVRRLLAAEGAESVDIARRRVRISPRPAKPEASSSEILEDRGAPVGNP